MSVTVITSGLLHRDLYDDSLPLFVLNDHGETTSLSGDLTEESDQFRFFHTVLDSFTLVVLPIFLLFP